MPERFLGWARRVLLGGLAAGAITPIFGQLRWTPEWLTLSAGASDQELRGEYAFENVGKEPVRLLSVKGSCGCTAAAARLAVYKPGERGTVAVTYTIGDRRGLRHEMVIVETSDPAMPKKALLLDVDIPTAARFNRARLEWKIGGAAEAQTVTLKIAENSPARATAATATSPKLAVRLVEVAPKIYEITAKPASAAEPLSGLIRVETTGGDLGAVTLPFRIRRQEGEARVPTRSR